jgi:hypothetical protein
MQMGTRDCGRHLNGPRALTTASYEPSPPLLAFLRAAFDCLSFPSALLLAV